LQSVEERKKNFPFVQFQTRRGHDAFEVKLSEEEKSNLLHDVNMQLFDVDKERNSAWWKGKELHNPAIFRLNTLTDFSSKPGEENISVLFKEISNHYRLSKESMEEFKSSEILVQTQVLIGALNNPFKVHFPKKKSASSYLLELIKRFTERSSITY